MVDFGGVYAVLNASGMLNSGYSGNPETENGCGEFNVGDIVIRKKSCGESCICKVISIEKDGFIGKCVGCYAFWGFPIKKFRSEDFRKTKEGEYSPLFWSLNQIGATFTLFLILVMLVFVLGAFIFGAIAAILP